MPTYPKSWMMLLLFVLGLSAFCPADQAPQGLPPYDQYYAIMMDGEKIGFGHDRQTFKDGKAHIASVLQMSLSRAGQAMTVTVTTESVETLDGKPVSFKSVTDMGMMKQTVEGRFENGKAIVTMSAGGQSMQRTIPVGPDVVMDFGSRLLMQKHGLKKGTGYTFKMFTPASPDVHEAKVVVEGREKVDILGRVTELHKLVMTQQSVTGNVTANGYFNDDLIPQKMTSEMMGMKMEFFACDKAFATSPAKTTSDFLDKLYVASPKPVATKGATSARYVIEPTAQDAELHFSQSATQTVEKDGEKYIITIREPNMPKGGSLPYGGDDEEAKKALKPTRMMQIEAEEIQKLAKQAVGDAKTPGEAAKRIEAFVADYVQTKDLSVGYGSALEVARTRQGDCTEHAVLAAALCRAAGIPAEVVSGIAYIPQWGGRENIFVGHAWFRVFIDGQWIPLDAALDGFDVGHIMLGHGDGNIKEYYGMLNTLGNFRIAEVQVKK